MAESDSTVPEVTELAEGLHRTLSKLFSILRRGDPNGVVAGDLNPGAAVDPGHIARPRTHPDDRPGRPRASPYPHHDCGDPPLEKIGLVKRSRDPSDLRAVLVDITPRGLAVHRESLANRHASLAAMLSQLTESDLDTLTKALAPLERLAAGEPAPDPSGESAARKQA